MGQEIPRHIHILILLSIIRKGLACGLKTQRMHVLRLQSELADIEKAQKDHREKKEKKDREIEEHNRALQELRDKAEQVRLLFLNNKVGEDPIIVQFVLCRFERRATN